MYETLPTIQKLAQERFELYLLAGHQHLTPEQQQRIEAILGSDGGQVAVSADYDEPEGDVIRRRRPRRMSSGLVIIGAGVGLLLVALAPVQDLPLFGLVRTFLHLGRGKRTAVHRRDSKTTLAPQTKQEPS